MLMADNCSMLDPWIYRPDSAWISEASALENAALTRALQMSLSETSTTSSASVADTFSSSLFPRQLAPSPSSSASSAAATLHRAKALGPSAGRVSKRKSRSVKRSSTTYINTDPVNFREMVQRITGAQLAEDPTKPVARFEPVRPAVGARASDHKEMCLPTLDTSALLLGGGAVAIQSQEGSFLPPPVDAAAFDFDSLFADFPTVDSSSFW